jgi:hypothetical protein
MAPPRLTQLSKVFVAALAASVFAVSGAAFGQEAYGPYIPARIEGPAPAFCGQRESVRAPDIMTYDRNTHSEVLVGGGPGRPTEVTGINRETGSSYSVKGDLAGPRTTDMCTVNAETGSGYAIRSGDNGVTMVNGIDGQTGRDFAVTQGPNGHGPDFRSFNPETGRSTLVANPPSGRPIVREFGPHALACTRGRLGLVEIGLGDC